MVNQFINVTCCIALWGLISLSTEGMHGTSATGSNQVCDSSPHMASSKETTIDKINNKAEYIKTQHKKLNQKHKKTKKYLKKITTKAASSAGGGIGDASKAINSNAKDDATQLSKEAGELSAEISNYEKLVSQYCQYLINISNIPNPGNFILSIGDPESLKNLLCSLESVKNDIEQYQKTANDILEFFKKTDDSNPNLENDSNGN